MTSAFAQAAAPSSQTQTNAANNPDIDALRTRSIESVTLAIEVFNRPSNVARPQTVLMLLHHAFELLLKSIIVERRGSAFDEERGFSFGFDKCLMIGCEDGFLTERRRSFLSILDAARDCAMHYYQEVSEQLLYIYAQASVTLYDELIRQSTGKSLLDTLPQRVMMLSALTPRNVGQVLDDEFAKLRDLLRHPDMSKQQAMAMLRPLMAFKVGGEGQSRRMTNAELETAVENLAAAETWRVAFPEIAHVTFDAEGGGIPIGFKIVKDAVDALPVRVLKPEEAHLAQGVVIQKEINIFDKFNLNLPQLAEHLGVTSSRTSAMVRELGVREDLEMFREIAVGATRHRRYSKKALDFLRSNIHRVEECWAKRRSELTSK